MNLPAPPAWEDLSPGQQITIVKLTPEGIEAARYPAEAVATQEPGGWVVARAVWTYDAVDVDGLQFVPGDTLLEWFSAEHPFNAFAVLAPGTTPRGWYANVTLPAYLERERDGQGRPVLVWHDLYLDLIGLPNGEARVLDEDELAASHLEERDPGRYGLIREGIAALQERFASQRIPFVGPEELIALARS